MNRRIASVTLLVLAGRRARARRRPAAVSDDPVQRPPGPTRGRSGAASCARPATAGGASTSAPGSEDRLRRDIDGELRPRRAPSASAGRRTQLLAASCRGRADVELSQAVGGGSAQQADQAGSPKRRGKTEPRRSQLIRGALADRPRPRGAGSGTVDEWRRDRDGSAPAFPSRPAPRRPAGVRATPRPAPDGLSSRALRPRSRTARPRRAQREPGAIRVARASGPAIEAGRDAIAYVLRGRRRVCSHA